jgi:hypothetical protein
MKIKLADIPVNILDGFAKYPQTSLITAGLVFGSVTAYVSMSAWPQMFGVLVAGAGVLAVAWYVGRPK